MNWRTRRIFGSQFSNFPFKPTRTHLIAVIAMLVVGAGIWFTVTEEESGNAKLIPKNDLTGAAVVAEQNQQQESQQTQEQQEQVTETQSEETAVPEEEPREFYEYKEQCARDMKQRQDDLNDVTTQIEDYQKALEQLQQEYDQKLLEIQQQYQVPLDNTQAKKEKAERQLEDIETQWAERKVICDQQYPA